MRGASSCIVLSLSKQKEPSHHERAAISQIIKRLATKPKTIHAKRPDQKGCKSQASDELRTRASYVRMRNAGRSSQIVIRARRRSTRNNNLSEDWRSDLGHEHPRRMRPRRARRRGRRGAAAPDVARGGGGGAAHVVAVVHVGVREVFRPAARVAHSLAWPGLAWGSPRRHSSCLPAAGCVLLLLCRAVRDVHLRAGPTARRMHHATPAGGSAGRPRARRSSWAHFLFFSTHRSLSVHVGRSG